MGGVNGGVWNTVSAQEMLIQFSKHTKNQIEKRMGKHKDLAVSSYPSSFCFGSTELWSNMILTNTVQQRATFSCPISWGHFHLTPVHTKDYTRHLSLLCEWLSWGDCHWEDSSCSEMMALMTSFPCHPVVKSWSLLTRRLQVLWSGLKSGQMVEMGDTQRPTFGTDCSH